MKDRSKYFANYYKKVRVPKFGFKPRVCVIRTGLKATDPLYNTTRHRLMRLKALQMVSGEETPRCINCGCSEFGLLQINHKNGGGRKESMNLKGENMYAVIMRGKRKVDDLDIRCSVCNILHYVGLKFGLEMERRFTIKWE